LRREGARRRRRTFMDLRERVLEVAREAIEVKRRFFEGELEGVLEAARLLVGTLRGGGKVLIFGNGGSAAQAQHIAAELVNRFRKDRKGLPALALTTDTSVLTSVANDYDFSLVFARQIEALGEAGDLAWGMTTSGRSPNVVKALQVAKQRGLRTLAFSGGDGGQVKEVAELCLVVPSEETPRIQEVHITLAHILCELAEDELF